MKNKVLFWDFDGTIIYSNSSFRDSLCTAMEKYNYDVSWDEAKEFLQTVCSWYKPEISYTDKAGQAWWDALFQELEVFYDSKNVCVEDRRKINREFKEYIMDYRNYKLYSDAIETMKECIALGYDNYVISNNFPELQKVADGFGVDEFITDYILSTNIGFEKPRKEIFEYAYEKAGKPEECYMIGDNPVADIQGAIGAGMKAILVHPGEKISVDKNCIVCKELRDVIDVIK